MLRLFWLLLQLGGLFLQRLGLYFRCCTLLPGEFLLNDDIEVADELFLDRQIEILNPLQELLLGFDIPTYIDEYLRSLDIGDPSRLQLVHHLLTELDVLQLEQIRHDIVCHLYEIVNIYIAFGG